MRGISSHSTVAILGGGPIGVEALLALRTLGVDVQLFERGAIGDSVLSWGHVRLFSPFHMNASPVGRRLLAEAGQTVPSSDSYLTGQQYIDSYVAPLTQLPELRDQIHEQTVVLGVGRARQLKGERIGQPTRRDTPFRILIGTANGEMAVTSQFVLDCTGTFPNHNWLGNGGIPCPGEREVEQAIEYGLPDFDGPLKPLYAGKRILVVGAGYSAATNVASLARLAATNPQTRVIWCTRTVGDAPIRPIPDDSLPQRAALTDTVNSLATQAGTFVEWLAGHVVESIHSQPSGSSLQVRCVPTHSADPSTTQAATLEVDRIIANVGFRPDVSVFQELQVHLCYASEGPMKLAATLLGESSADCLQQAVPGPETLINPESDFFVLGAKSYGRNSRFLIRIGLEQVAQVSQLITQRVRS